MNDCHAEFVVVERSPDKAGFRSRLPELNIRSWVDNSTFTSPQILQPPLMTSG